MKVSRNKGQGLTSLKVDCNNDHMMVSNGLRHERLVIDRSVFINNDKKLARELKRTVKLSSSKGVRNINAKYYTAKFQFKGDGTNTCKTTMLYNNVNRYDIAGLLSYFEKNERYVTTIFVEHKCVYRVQGDNIVINTIKKLK